ncbi:MAG: UDP-N-acetylmuramate--L-alanine ligase [Negativicutes bacterium]|nr:UDP-N-acetylmuramate--L-alanine ligase [Negativicutes bacterium]
MLDGIQKFHFVGIGGAGMSAIAKVLLEMGLQVTGSDLSKSEYTSRLEQLGAKVYLGHARENIQGAEALVISTAIRSDNPELAAAREINLPVFHRADMVAALMNRFEGIAVAGAHGKTTTTSMIALMLEKSGLDPTIIIGGELDDIGGNAKLGTGRYLVAEADESDGSFLKLSPTIAVVTNIENDHMDFYETMENIIHAFKEFLHKLPADGLAVLCFDNPSVRNITTELGRRHISYAIDHAADFTARNICTQGPNTSYDAYYRGQLLGTVRLGIPGRHNVANSLAAVAVGHSIGLTFDQICLGLAPFRGAKRRFQTKGKIEGVWIVDDYAHHPTEIKTTLLAARQTEPKRLISVFQPHRFTRTKYLREEFGRAFMPADLLILTDIYAAGEDPIPGISGEVIKDEVERQTGQQVVYIPQQEKIARYLEEIAEPGDLIMTMGAGNIYQTGEELVERLLRRQEHTLSQ